MGSCLATCHLCYVLNTELKRSETNAQVLDQLIKYRNMIITWFKHYIIYHTQNILELTNVHTTLPVISHIDLSPNVSKLHANR